MDCRNIGVCETYAGKKPVSRHYAYMRTQRHLDSNETYRCWGVTASMPPANEKLNQLKPGQEATEAAETTEATEAEEKTQKTQRPNAETASTLANATGAADGSGATGLQSVAQRTQRQKKKPPRGAMWFVPGETETASSRAKSEVKQETVETVQEEPPDTDQEVTREASDDPWQTLEDNRQLAWAFAQESESEPVDVWDQAPDANRKALAWEELEKAEIELSKLKEEGLGLHQEEESLEPLTTEPLTTEPPQELPIEALRTDILERVRQHRATILVGATGCGKSTRLPQYIMEERGSKVLVTQPRRVAAVEIAKRVAAERGERVGKNVGYRISGETVAGNGKLQFATIGQAACFPLDPSVDILAVRRATSSSTCSFPFWCFELGLQWDCTRET